MQSVRSLQPVQDLKFTEIRACGAENFPGLRRWTFSGPGKFPGPAALKTFSGPAALKDSPGPAALENKN
jgi:hypothetical protein